MTCINRSRIAAALCAAALTAAPAHAQFAQSGTAYYKTASHTLSTDITGNDVFVGKTTAFATLPGTITLTVATGATITGWEIAAAAGQMGCVMKLYRDWKLCGDADFLRGLWQNAKQSLAFAWLPGGWDADRDGVMEGCQHNTMDVDYHGANGQMTLWYLGALRAGGEMATAMGDTDFADECRYLFETGSRLADTTLFNGEYYEHHIAPCLPENVRAGLAGGTETVEGELSLQLGAGCLIDQLVGQYMADVCGLGYLVAPQNVDKTLSAILRYNRCDNLWGHFNPMRSYALDGESALLMASYPRGNRPTRPFPYFGEVMDRLRVHRGGTPDVRGSDNGRRVRGRGGA